MKHLKIETALLESQSIINSIKNLPDEKVENFDYSWIEPQLKKIWKNVNDDFWDEYTSLLIIEYLLAIIKSKLGYIHNSYNYNELISEEIALQNRWNNLCKELQYTSDKRIPFSTGYLPGKTKGYMINPVTPIEKSRKKYINEVIRKQNIIKKILSVYTDKFKVYFIGSVIKPKLFHDKSDVDIAVITHVDDLTAKKIKNELRKLLFSFGKLDVYIFGETGYIKKGKIRFI